MGELNYIIHQYPCTEIVGAEQCGLPKGFNDDPGAKFIMLHRLYVVFRLNIKHTKPVFFLLSVLVLLLSVTQKTKPIYSKHS